MPEVRFLVPNDLYQQLKKDAAAINLRLSQYAKMKVLGLLKEERPAVRHTAEVGETSAIDGKPLGPRIMALAFEQYGWDKISSPHGVTKLALGLGVDRRRVQSALGSLVAGKHLRRSMYSYYPAGVVRPPTLEGADLP